MIENATIVVFKVSANVCDVTRRGFGLRRKHGLMIGAVSMSMKVADFAHNFRDRFLDAVVDRLERQYNPTAFDNF